MNWILGINSKIGRLVELSLIKSNIDFRATTRSKNDNLNYYFDLADKKINLHFEEGDSALICLGLTDISFCEKHNQKAFQLNVFSTIKLLEYLRARGVYFIIISSSSIFEGQVKDCDINSTPSPKSIYAQTKLEIEDYCLTKFKTGFSILRTTKVVTEDWDLLKLWRERLDSKQIIHPFSNRMISPVCGTKIAEVLLLLFQQKPNGLYQIGAEKRVPYAEFCYKYFEKQRFSAHLIQPVLDQDSNREKFQTPNLITKLPE